MVSYQDVLSRLYDKSLAANDTADVPNWYHARQRRIKTNVGVSLGQQPAATAAAASKAITPQDEVDRKGTSGKKINGLAQPGQGGKKGESYWFSDYRGGDNETAKKPADSGGNDGAGNNSHSANEALHTEFWFSKGGGDEAALHEMATWRPTKDVAIAIDLKKTKNSQKAAVAGESSAAEGVMLAPKPPLVTSRHQPV